MGPVMYNDNNQTDSHLCSYIPVLYLNSSLGVVGGLYYGLRKEYRPNMIIKETERSKSWDINDTIHASFIETVEQQPVIPNFFARSFMNPFVTISYPPRERTIFYQATVYPVTVKNATGIFQWDYKGAIIKDTQTSWSTYSKYWFTM